MIRCLRILKSIALAVCLLTPAAGCEWLLLHKGFPQTDGTIGGLPVREPVEVIRDAHGIPHIYGQNEHDLMVALGTVHAQDRLWQMEIFRRMAAGRLSEVAGRDTIEIDHWARLLELRRMSAEMATRLDEPQKRRSEAYLAGINAHIERRAGDLPLEFQELKAVPEPWTLDDLYNVVVANAWFLETNLPQEWIALAAREHVDFEGLKDLLPSYPNAVLPDDSYFDDLRALKIGNILPAMESLYYAVSEIDRLGSNNWVVAKGADGKPLLAGDPHLELGVPPVWYFGHLSAPGFQTAGATMPGIPTVVMGHNGHIAWSFTNTMADTVDLYVYRLDPSRPGHYIRAGQSIPFGTETQVYKVAGEPDQVRMILRTDDGPVVTEMCAGCDAVAVLKWYGSASMNAMGDERGVGALPVSRAKNVTEAFDAARTFKLQSQNLVVADVQGNIGWHALGGVPIRKGYSGRLPADGSSGTMEWDGSVPYDAMPYEYNPERGWIATANNKTTTDDAPYPLTYAWCPPYRVNRISQLLNETQNPTPADFQRIQMDVHTLQADWLVPKLAAYEFDDPRAQEALSFLKDWDRNADADSVGAAIYEVFLVRFARGLVADELGDEVRWYFRLMAAAYLAHDVALDRLDSPLWDDVNTREKESPDEILERALVDTIRWLEEQLGTDRAEWQWGRIHRYFWAHPGAKGSIEHRLLSRGPFPAPGDNVTINMGAYDAGNDKYDVLFMPSFRMIAPLGDLNQATIAGPMGQSGQPGHRHYDDLLDEFRAGGSVPLLFTREAVEQGAASRLVLEP
jgi:penicillin amidase